MPFISIPDHLIYVKKRKKSSSNLDVWVVLMNFQMIKKYFDKTKLVFCISPINKTNFNLGI